VYHLLVSVLDVRFFPLFASLLSHFKGLLRSFFFYSTQYGMVSADLPGA
jgi:hypothetical protein